MTAGVLAVLALLAVQVPAVASGLPPGISATTRMAAVAQAPDGKIVATGSTGGSALIAKYTADGQLDPAFGTDGGLIVEDRPADERDSANGVGVQSGGAVIVLITRYSQAGVLTNDLQRFKADGARDLAFGGDGEVDLPSSGLGGFIVDPDDGIVALSNSTSEQDPQSTIVLQRFAADGLPDPDFGMNGIASLPQADDGVYASDLRRDGEGRYAVLTRSDSEGGAVAVIRTTGNGTLDTTFGGGDGVSASIPPIAEYSGGSGLGITEDGQIIAGSTGTSLSSHGCSGHALAQFDQDGAINSSFGRAGYANFKSLFGCSSITATSISDTGRIFVAGSAFSYQLAESRLDLVAFDAGGLPSPAFGNDGEAHGPYGLASAYAVAVLAEHDDGALIAGSTDSSGYRCVGGDTALIGGECGSFLLARYDRNGKLDRGFGRHGVAMTPRFSTCRLRRTSGRLVLPDDGRRLEIDLRYSVYRSSRIAASLDFGDHTFKPLLDAITKNSGHPETLKRTARLKPRQLRILRRAPEDVTIKFTPFLDPPACDSRRVLTRAGPEAVNVLNFR